MELSWTPSALRDLDEAGNYVSQDNSSTITMAGMGRRISEAVSNLEQYPALGRLGLLRHTREIVVSGTPFIVIYRVRLDVIQVLRVLQYARK